MKTITKSLVATAAAGAMAMASATPAMAQRGDRHRDHDGISTGEVIAGALVIGGIAAIAASSGRDRDYRDGRYDRDRDNYYSRYGNPRSAVEQCVNAAESRANRYSYGGRADVTDIRSVKDTRYGYTVKGRIAVNSSGRGWRNGDNRYGRGWGNDYRGWNDNLRGYDAGNFTCKVSGSRVQSVNFSGIRGL